MDWADIVPHCNRVRKNGIAQFMSLYHSLALRRRDYLLWGDELEYCVVQFEQDLATLSLEACKVLEKLQAIEDDSTSAWHPEYGRYMLEGTPRLPYGHTFADFLCVEDNMRQRFITCNHSRTLASSLLDNKQVVMSLTHFPMLGQGEWCTPYTRSNLFGGHSHSLFVTDEAIGLHARFRTLTSNIRKRRGSKVQINVPIFIDTETPRPFRESLPLHVQQLLQERGENIPVSLPDYTPDALEDHIYMDAMCFGMGSSCLQVTFQACSVEQARRLYDQLIPMAPLMLTVPPYPPPTV